MHEQPLPQMTGREINAVLAGLSLLPIETDLLGSLMSKYGDRFKRAVLWAKENPDAFVTPGTDEERKQGAYLRAVSTICNASVTAGLERLQLECNPQTRVELAQSHALYRMFKSAFELAVRGDGGAKHALTHAISEARRNAIAMQDMGDSRPAPPERVPQEPSRNPATSETAMTPSEPASYPSQRPPQQQPRQLPSRPASSSKPDSAGNRSFGPSKHIYGGSGALCFQVSTPDPSGDQPPSWGIHIEGAKGANRVYQWNEKINLRFNDSELPFFLGVLLGYLLKFEGNSHGPKNDKFFSIENQGDKFFVKVGQGSKENLKCVSVPMTLGDAFWVSCLFLKVLMQSTALSETMVIHLVRMACEQRNGVRRDQHNSQRNAA